MKQFKIILKFELMNYLKNKIFAGVTIFLVIVIAIVMFFPRISAFFDKKETPAEGNLSATAISADTLENEDAPADGKSSVMLISADTPENTETAGQAFAAAFAGYDVRTTNRGFDWIAEQITSGRADCAFVMDSLTSYTYYVDNLTMYDHNTMTADEVLQNIYRMSRMTENGIPAEQAGQILAVSAAHEVKSLGKDQIQNFFYTYIMIFALYMVILLYGQMVATNVATEKSSRAMELLITSAKPVSMMFGKVIASCLAGLLQLSAVFGSAFLFFNLNRGQWEDNQIINSIFDMPLELLLYMLVFFVLGFFVYAFLYGAIGSTASKLEDINTSVMPLTMLFILGFLVVILSMTSGNIDNTLMKICSYVPFTSPMAMFTRIAMSTVPVYETVLSIAILIVSVLGIGILSAKIYRVGVLLYGTTPKLRSIIAAVRKA